MTLFIESLLIGGACGLLRLHVSGFETPWIAIIPWFLIRVTPLTMNIVQLAAAAREVDRARQLDH